MNKDFSARVRAAYETAFGALLGRYTKMAMLPIRQKWLAAAGVTVAFALTALLLKTVPTGFVPDEDMGSLMIDVSAPSTIRSTASMSMPRAARSLASRPPRCSMN